MDFGCVEGCADCCRNREYYPSKEFGKVGVLLLPHERGRIEGLAVKLSVNVSVLPRIGVSGGDGAPKEVLAYQMMGADRNGDTCPFLDMTGRTESPHGGAGCRIYGERPLACRAYPLLGAEPPELDAKCRFCKECGTADGGMEREKEALVRIQGAMRPAGLRVWRFATGVGEERDAGSIKRGWFAEG